MKLRWRIAFLVLCTVGACLSADLIRLHIKVHTDPEYHSYCAISERVNCETVAASEYAVIFRLPLAVWGMLTYITMGALCIWGLRRPLSPPSWPFGILFWMNLFSSVFSLYLFGVSHYVIKSICVVCTGTYIVNFSLLGTAFAEIRQYSKYPVKVLADELRSFATRKISLGLLGLSLIVIVVILWLAVPPYWHVEESTGPGGFPVGVTQEGHPWIGAANPKLIITEFSDYQCPYCRLGHAEMRKLIETYPDRVRLIHRYFPLDNACNEEITALFHPYACTYAYLAYCAQQQKQFWEANDYIFINGRRNEPITTRELASVLNLNENLLERCVSSPETKQAILKDLAEGRALKIRGTPTYVIDDQTYPGRIPQEIILNKIMP
jgi:protein-disulfide isomerase/uncharacterized membrane protein